MRSPYLEWRPYNNASASICGHDYAYPDCFSTVGFYYSTVKLQLPISSLVDEFEAGNVRLYLILRDSPDQVIRETQPEIKAGTKWSAKAAVENAEASLQIKEIIGVTQTGRSSLVRALHRWLSYQGPKDRREMTIEEIRFFEEEKRTAIAAGQTKQCV
jgi:hypothetical protein